MLRVTADTNLVNTKGKIAAMNTIEQWAREGRLRLLAPPRVVRELAGTPSSRAKAAEREQPAEPAIVGLGAVIGPHLVVGEALDPREVHAVMFPTIPFRRLTDHEHESDGNHANDVMTLIAHHASAADVLLTTDKDFLRCRDSLRDRFGVVVQTPAEFVAAFGEEGPAL